MQHPHETETQATVNIRSSLKWMYYNQQRDNDDDLKDFSLPCSPPPSSIPWRTCPLPASCSRAGRRTRGGGRCPETRRGRSCGPHTPPWDRNG